MMPCLIILSKRPDLCLFQGFVQMCSGRHVVYIDFVPLGRPYTVKRVDEVVRHPHLVTQDQNTQVSNKVSDIHVENSIINIELFLHFSQVIELVRYDYISHVELIVCKCRTSSTELEFFKSSMHRLGSNLQSSHPQSCTLPLRHTFFLV